jgi:hypothetical protein
MSTHSGNGNLDQPLAEVVSAESDTGSAVSGKIAPPPGQLKKADFTSDQEVRWCPGCGDYAILNSAVWSPQFRPLMLLPRGETP